MFRSNCDGESGWRGGMITVQRKDTVKIIKRANIVIIDTSNVGTKVAFLGGAKS